MVGAFPYAVRKTLYMMVAEFKTEIEVARCWARSRSASGSQVLLPHRG